ncbi:MAG: hypothetical protein ACP5M4_10265 [Acidobacteriaceae bacterium]
MGSVTLTRPVGEAELALIRESDWKRFPPRLPEQPIFYPVVEEEYAIQIAREWNVRDEGVGYVLRFAVDGEYIARFDVQTRVRGFTGSTGFRRRNWRSSTGRLWVRLR